MIRFAGPPVRFMPGQLVRHKRYGYLGVVVDFDPFCEAPESWYQNNQTQPDRHQPWYHVLIDGGSHITYAAQTSLDEAERAVPIEHPLVDAFFSEFNGCCYVRNNRPWPGMWD
jgi:heat shock protein HspQ